ncbi:ABC-type transport auxiliary lipoprotein family protein [Thiorhodococcus mannitoliphagus]|nr:ABC-type transport auxiliary lipoprotein family protein [Thiorhodococcus mannitoliphagus]
MTVLVVALVGACGTAPPLPRDRYYSLAPDVQAPVAGQRVAAILQVNDLAARGFLGGRQILYRFNDQPLVVERYETYLWEEPVPRAFAAVLVSAIRDAGVFRHVLIPADPAKPDLLLGGEVERFEHRPTDAPPRVSAKLSLSLVRTDDRRSLWTRQYSGDEPVSADTPDAMAEAFNRLAGRLAAEVTRDLISLGAKLGPRTGS